VLPSPAGAVSLRGRRNLGQPHDCLDCSILEEYVNRSLESFSNALYRGGNNARTVAIPYAALMAGRRSYGGLAVPASHL